MRVSSSMSALAAIAALLVTAGAAHGQQADVMLTEWRPQSATTVEPVVSPDADAPADEEWTPERRAMAGAASYLMPGAGQFYRGDRTRGAVMLGAFAAAVTYAVVAGIGEGDVCAGTACTTGLTVNNRFWWGLGTAAGVHAWSVVDALAHRERR